MAIHWHTKTAGEVLRHWSSSETGLVAAEAAERLKTHGPNVLTERRGKGPLAMLWDQFTETMVLILIAAGVISGFLGKGTETAAILAIGVLAVGGNALFSVASTLGYLSIVSVLSALGPVFVMVLAYVFLHERLSRAQFLGVASALIGVALIAAG